MTFDEFTVVSLPSLLRFAVVLTGDRGLAEDVTQEVLVRVHLRWAKIGVLDQPEHYIRRMVVNEYLSWRRRWSRIVPHADPPDRPDPVPDFAATHAERDALRTELDKLPRRQRAVLVLRYYAGMSDPEIADVLGCSAGTVRGYASRAPDTTTVLSGLSRVRARRVARRRTTVVVAAAVVAATVAGGSIMVTNHDPAPRTGQDTAREHPEWFRFPFSVDEVPGHTVTYGYANAGRGASTAVVTAVEYRAGSTDQYEITAFPKGEYDATGDQAGQPVTVNGDEAFLLPRMSCQCDLDHSVPGVVWEYAPESWAMVQYTRPAGQSGDTPLTEIRDTLLAVAKAVRFDRPVPIRVPFRLGYLPERLRPTDYVKAAMNIAIDDVKSVSVSFEFATGSMTIMASASTATAPPVGEPAVQHPGGPDGPVLVVVNLGGYLVTLSGLHVPVADLERIARSVTGADLSDPSRWPSAEEALQPR